MKDKKKVFKLILSLSISFSIVYLLSRTVFLSYTPDLRIDLSSLREQLGFRKEDDVQEKEFKLGEGIEAVGNSKKIMIESYELNSENFEVINLDGKSVVVIGPDENRQTLKNVLDIK